MRNLLFSIGINILLGVTSIAGCKSDKKPNIDIADQLHQSDYTDRIKNIFNYIQENRFNIPVNQCGNIVILQTNLCNSCDNNKLSIILKDLSDVKEPIYFILADDNVEIKEQLNKKRAGSSVFIDSNYLLKKHNLSFLRNLKIRICERKIDKWSFL